MRNTIIKSISKGKFISVARNISTDGVDDKLYKTSSLRGHITNRKVYSGIKVCEYEERADVKRERAEGKEKQKPTWWSWVDYPYIAKHNTKGIEYLVVKCYGTTKVKSEYFVDGEKTPKSALRGHFKAQNTTMGRCMFIPLNEVVAINGKPIR